MVHPIIVRVSWWTTYFQPTMSEPTGFGLGGERHWRACPTPIEVLYFQKKAIVFGSLAILVMSISWLHIDLDKLQNEATP